MDEVTSACPPRLLAPGLLCPGSSSPDTARRAGGGRPRTLLNPHAPCSRHTHTHGHNHPSPCTSCKTSLYHKPWQLRWNRGSFFKPEDRFLSATERKSDFSINLFHQSNNPEFTYVRSEHPVSGVDVIAPCTWSTTDVCLDYAVLLIMSRK